MPKKRIYLRPCASLSYLIGVAYGDAYVGVYKDKGSTSHRYKYILTAKDYDFVLMVEKALKKVVNNRVYTYPRKKYFTVETANKTLVQFLKKPFNYVKSFIEKHPEDFLRGLFDSDGGLYKEGRVYRVRLYNTNWRLLNYVKYLLLQKFGIISSDIWLNAPAGRELNYRGKIIRTTKPAWVLQIVRKTSVAIYMHKIGFSIARKNGVWTQKFLE